MAECSSKKKKSICNKYFSKAIQICVDALFCTPMNVAQIISADSQRTPSISCARFSVCVSLPHLATTACEMSPEPNSLVFRFFLKFPSPITFNYVLTNWHSRFSSVWQLADTHCLRTHTHTQEGKKKRIRKTYFLLRNFPIFINHNSSEHTELGRSSSGTNNKIIIKHFAQQKQ